MRHTSASHTGFSPRCIFDGLYSVVFFVYLVGFVFSCDCCVFDWYTRITLSIWSGRRIQILFIVLVIIAGVGSPSRWFAQHCLLAFDSILHLCGLLFEHLALWRLQPPFLGKLIRTPHICYALPRFGQKWAYLTCCVPCLLIVFISGFFVFDYLSDYHFIWFIFEMFLVSDCLCSVNVTLGWLEDVVLLLFGLQKALEWFRLSWRLCKWTI